MDQNLNRLFGLMDAFYTEWTRTGAVLRKKNEWRLLYKTAISLFMLSRLPLKQNPAI